MNNVDPESEATRQDSSEKCNTDVKNVVAKRHVAFGLILGLTLLSGVIHGYFDGRWAARTDLVQQGRMLDNLPLQVGQWQLIDTQPLEDNAAKLLRCYGSTVRTYQNEVTGATVNVGIMFGPRGPIAVHTPEVCYSSINNKQLDQRRIETIDSSAHKHTLWSVQFAKDNNPDPVLEVWYGWSDGGPWQARERPRFWLTDNLYKIQVAGPVKQGETRPVKDFMTEFLPPTQESIQ